jgi:hypothetical protein
MTELTLGPEDPTVFAKCNRCDPGKPGSKVGNYYGRAYPRRKWDRKPKCENCKTPMSLLFEVKS